MSSEEESYGVPYKVTLKAGAGFEAPWLTIEADTTSELAGRLAALRIDDALDRVVETAHAFKKKFVSAPSVSKSAPPASTPPESPPPSSPASGADTNLPNAAVDVATRELEAATSLAELRAVYPKYKAVWTDAHTALAQARAKTLS